MDDFKRTLERNLGRSEHYVADTAAPVALDEYVRLVAFYLPQFHRIPENDKWWGAGFTEWTNVTKALPRFSGHYQPHLPEGLGFYDLKNIETLREQAALARRYGIEGFCFHYYWFSGRELLESPIKALLRNPEIDIKFCLNWANESWCRSWDGRESEVLVKQNYGPGDDRSFAVDLLQYVRDRRYIRIGNRPLVMIYRPKDIPNAREMIEVVREVFRSDGEENPYIAMVQSFGDRDPAVYGMDGAIEFPPHKVGTSIPDINGELQTFDSDYSGVVFRYDDIVRASTVQEDTAYRVFKGVCPAWDNTARKAKNGHTYAESTPEKYGRWLEMACRQTIAKHPPEERLVFINAWNEWAEGAHLEPDRHFGWAYLAETRNVHTRLQQKTEAIYSEAVRINPWNKFRFKAKRALRRIWASFLGGKD